VGRTLDDRLRFREPLRQALGRLFPGPWSFLLGEITLFSFVALVSSGTYLALFYDPGHAYATVVEISERVPLGLVGRRFHHFSAHLFLGSLVLHAARVYFTGAFRRPRELTWWIGLLLLALALINGFSGYCLPWDMRAGTATRMMVTTLESVPWVGGWLATLAIGAPFPGHLILGRLFIAHVFVIPALLAAFIGLHLFLVVRLTHTDYPGRGRTEDIEVGSPLWPEQTARSTSLAFLVFGWTALLSAFLPVESVSVYGPFQPLSSYAPLQPDWFLMWIEGTYRLLPRQLGFHLLGANFTNPFYGAVLLPLVVFGGCALYPIVDARIYRTAPRDHHILEHPAIRPFRTAFGVGGLVFLVMLSVGGLDDRIASAFRTEVWTVDLVLGILTLLVPPATFVAAFAWLRPPVLTPGGQQRTHRSPRVSNRSRAPASRARARCSKVRCRRGPRRQASSPGSRRCRHRPRAAARRRIRKSRRAPRCVAPASWSGARPRSEQSGSRSSSNSPVDDRKVPSPSWPLPFSVGALPRPTRPGPLSTRKGPRPSRPRPSPVGSVPRRVGPGPFALGGGRRPIGEGPSQSNEELLLLAEVLVRLEKAVDRLEKVVGRCDEDLFRLDEALFRSAEVPVRLARFLFQSAGGLFRSSEVVFQPAKAGFQAKKVGFIPAKDLLRLASR
jgi:ubiquinol-cytochrome c reductase cytochrome b subunit